MLFTEPIFLFFVLPLACLAFYFFTPKYGPSVGLGILLVISLLFYLPWGLFYFGLLILSITVNFAASYLLLEIPNSHTRRRKAVLLLGLLYNVGSLIWFKYRLPVLHGLGILKSGNEGFSLVDAAIPIGISFYTFQQSIFLLDAFHRDSSVEAYLGDHRKHGGKLRSYIHHAFFVAFFPHLVIGPIVYLREFQPQVDAPRFGRLRVRDLEVGLTLIAIGLFKKIVFADSLATIANHAFVDADLRIAISPATASLSMLAYYAQLYFDFSGYSDMAVGAARTLGVKFPINFFSPLKAVGIMDFYRRWHITLTRVIARFLYTPLSVTGARFALKRRWTKLPTRAVAQWVPLLLNFVVIALWHGARLTFVVFGLIHGVWYVVESEIRATKTFKSWKRKTPDTARATLGRVFFTILMLFTFALFRSSSLSSFGYLLTQMFKGGTLVPANNRKILMAAFAVIWFAPNATEFLRRYRPGILTYENANYGFKSLQFAWRPNALWAILVLVMVAVSIYCFNRQSPFLYMGF